MRSSVRVQTEAFDPGELIAMVHHGDTATGAVASFVGYLRDLNLDDEVVAMHLEHYPAMTRDALEAIVRQAGERWSLQAVGLVHRVGELRPGDPIVGVAVAGSHRGEAFQACEFIMDYLKNRAPLWKKEVLADGSSRWVEQRQSDREAEQRW